MPGGSLHWPLWAPYALYGEVDHVYGFVAFNARDGFTSAQGLLNAVETTMYLAYLYTVLLSGGSSGKAGETRTVSGREGARAVLIGFSAAVMTLSKTVLYCVYLLSFCASMDTVLIATSRGQRVLQRFPPHRPQHRHRPPLPLDHPQVSPPFSVSLPLASYL